MIRFFTSPRTSLLRYKSLTNLIRRCLSRLVPSRRRAEGPSVVDNNLNTTCDSESKVNWLGKKEVQHYLYEVNIDRLYYTMPCDLYTKETVPLYMAGSRSPFAYAAVNKRLRNRFFYTL